MWAGIYFYGGWRAFLGPCWRWFFDVLFHNRGAEHWHHKGPTEESSYHARHRFRIFLCPGTEWKLCQISFDNQLTSQQSATHEHKNMDGRPYQMINKLLAD